MRNDLMNEENDSMGPMEFILSDMDLLCADLVMSLQDNSLGDPVIGRVAFQQIKHNLEAFREQFTERGGVAGESDAVNRCYQPLQDPLGRLDNFFQSIQGREFDIEERRLAYYVASYLANGIDQLSDVARQLDINSAVLEVPEAGGQGREVIDLGQLRIILPQQGQ